MCLGTQGGSEWETFIEEVAFQWIGFSKDEQGCAGEGPWRQKQQHMHWLRSVLGFSDESDVARIQGR